MVLIFTIICLVALILGPFFMIYYLQQFVFYMVRFVRGRHNIQKVKAKPDDFSFSKGSNCKDSVDIITTKVHNTAVTQKITQLNFAIQRYNVLSPNNDLSRRLNSVYLPTIQQALDNLIVAEQLGTVSPNTERLVCDAIRIAITAINNQLKENVAMAEMEISAEIKAMEQVAMLKGDSFNFFETSNSEESIDPEAQFPVSWGPLHGDKGIVMEQVIDDFILGNCLLPFHIINVGETVLRNSLFVLARLDEVNGTESFYFSFGALLHFLGDFDGKGLEYISLLEAHANKEADIIQKKHDEKLIQWFRDIYFVDNSSVYKETEALRSWIATQGVFASQHRAANEVGM